MSKPIKYTLIVVLLSVFMTVYSLDYVSGVIEYTYKPNECFEGFNPNSENQLYTYTEEIRRFGFPFGYIEAGGCTPSGDPPVPPFKSFSPIRFVADLVFYSALIMGAFAVKSKFDKKSKSENTSAHEKTNHKK